MVENVSTHLQDHENRSVEVANGAELQIGCSVIKLVLPERATDPANRKTSPSDAPLIVNIADGPSVS